MEKMVKIARNLDIMAKTAAIVCWVSAGLFTLLTVILIFCDTELFSQASTVITLGELSLEIAPDFLPEAVHQKFRSVIGLLLVIALVSFAGNIMNILRNILQPIIQQQPFHETVHQNMKKLGRLTLILGIVLPILKTAIQLTVFKMYDIRSLFLPEAISGYTLNYKLDLTLIIVAAMLFLLSYIFKYGHQLQTESDETL